MSIKTFQGRPVIVCDDDYKFFFYDLFTMIDDSCGPAHFMRTDEACSYHFEALRKRIADLCCLDECHTWITVGLGDS